VVIGAAHVFGARSRILTGEDPTGRSTFEHLYDACYRDVYRYVARRVPGGPGSPDASDITAEVFTTAWRRIALVPPPPDDRLWLFGVAKRTLLRSRRAAWRRERLHRRLMAEALVAGAHRPDDPAWKVRRALSKLRPRDREVLYLIVWDGLSHAEAAIVLGCSVSSVGVRMHRARNRLESQLQLDMSLPPTVVEP
jgi:RNA polymerase sigma factor (sigma-70 family)